VCFVVGARPNFMKVAPVVGALRDLDDARELPIVHTGQHYDGEMSAVFLAELGLPEPTAFLGVGSGTHAEQTAKALVGVERFLIERPCDLVVVAGDVNSTLAAALAASKLHVPVAHIESGLRSFDESMPEEANRRLTDHLSTLLFAHSDSAVSNLAAEGIADARVHLVGNTMIDSLLRYLPTARAKEPWLRLGVDPGGFALVTLHRPALVDEPATLRRTVDALVALAEELPLVFPVHPRTSGRLAEAGIAPERLRERRLVLCPPLGYLDFLGLEAAAAFVLTDSGGVQEETSALGVRCFTLRDTTERPITVDMGTNTILGADPGRIASIPDLLAAPHSARPIPLWDGRAGVRAADVIDALLAPAIPLPSGGSIPH
jgi:UDP-N-acetylglucosamine 2-epimerase (non-hydrolysing)